MELIGKLIVSHLSKFCLKAVLSVTAIYLAPTNSKILYAKQNNPQSISEIDLFRSYFFSFLDEKFKIEDLDQMVLYPPKQLFIPPKASDRCLKHKVKLLSRFRLQKPENLSKKRPLIRFKSPEKKLASLTDPVNIIVFPGIFSEFIENRPFESILMNSKSKLSTAWNKEINLKSNGAPMADAFNLKDLSIRPISIENVLSLASVDDSHGESLINLIYLHPPFGSLETLGSIQDKKILYLQRIEMLFTLLDLPGPIYFLGYSQGANVALDLLSSIPWEILDSRSWKNRIRGMISLGGALFGSALADFSIKKGEINDRLLDILKTLVENLEGRPTRTKDIPRLVAENAEHLTRSFNDIKEVFSISPERDIDPIDLGSRIKLASIINLAYKVLTQQFEIHHTLHYFKNIDRFKVLIAKICETIEALSSETRWRWWENHTLPNHIEYYSLSGTMPSWDGDDKRPSKVSQTKSSNYGLETGDYLLLNESYKDFVTFSGLRLNDSQVSAPASMFWPTLHTKINSKQERYESHFLGLLGTHHWGMAFPFAFETKNGKTNGFPRESLLKALISTALTLDPRPLSQ